jgi:signal peptide peptidase SppA
MSERRYSRVASRIFRTPLAIEPTRLRSALDGIGPRLFGRGPQAMEDEGGGAGKTIGELEREARMRRLMTIVGGEGVSVADGMGDYILTPDGIAVVSIVGTLVSRFDWMSAWCGLLSYDALGVTLDAALDDGRVRAILLDVDSPGGEAAGCFDLAREIAEARAVKPIWAIANSLAASAAYALAASADRLYAPAVAFVGSVGVVMVHCDQSGYDEKLGAGYTAIYSGARKIDGWGHAPLADEARAVFQGECDAIRGIFAQSVADARSLKLEDVLATEAGVYLGGPALELGFIDGIATFEDVVRELAAETAAGGPRGSAALLSGEETMKRRTEGSAAPVIAAAGDGAKPKDGETTGDGKTGDGKTADGKTGDGAGDEGEGEGDGKPGKTPAEDPVAAGIARERARSEAIMDLCHLAGAPVARANELIKAGMSEEQARLALKGDRDAVVARGAGPAIAGQHAATGQDGAAASWSEVYDRENKRLGVTPRR